MFTLGILHTRLGFLHSSLENLHVYIGDSWEIEHKGTIMTLLFLDVVSSGRTGHKEVLSWVDDKHPH